MGESEYSVMIRRGSGVVECRIDDVCFHRFLWSTIIKLYKLWDLTEQLRLHDVRRNLIAMTIDCS